MSDTLLDRINAFDRWHYEFELGGYRTPIFRADHRNRHQQRREYFFKTLVHLCGGHLKGKTVLDLGCNAGFWSLNAINAGCAHVCGIDGRQSHIDQTQLVFETHGVAADRYSFVCGDVVDVLASSRVRYDIVLFLGLMYHISKPVELMELISGINSDLLVIDTEISRKPGSLFEVRHESVDEPRNAIDRELVLVPTAGAVLDLIEQFGYAAKVLRPQFTDYEGAPDYRDGWRRAFIGSKATELSFRREEVERDPRIQVPKRHRARPPAALWRSVRQFLRLY